MINNVIKTNGTLEQFYPQKLNLWAAYASKQGGDWSAIAMEVNRRLVGDVKSSTIHQTMINVCLEEEDMTHSRIAARLEYGTLRKGMASIGLSDKHSFLQILGTLCHLGVWDRDSLPSESDLIKYNVDEVYKILYPTFLEYWQVKQFSDKYALEYKDTVVETPLIAAMGLALALHSDNIDKAMLLAEGIVTGKTNMPTPVMNGCRNGDFDGISCCVITGGDTVDSIGVAEHIAYKMTAKKAGIGIEMQTRSKGSPVKNGSVDHLGKHGIYQTVDRAVKMFTQVTRGGSATMTYTAIDPEIMEMLQWKTQKVDIETRIDKMDYSFAYNEAFLQAVITNGDWYLLDLNICPDAHKAFYTGSVEYFNSVVHSYIERGVPHKVIKARELLKMFLTCRQETGRIYCLNVSRVNQHTPFEDTITLSNLCQEINLPTKPYLGMHDLYATEDSIGETAFCTLAGINAGKVSLHEYPKWAKVVVNATNALMDKVVMMTPSMTNDMRNRRSIGIGITGLASYLHNLDLDYDGSEESFKAVQLLSEYHYFHLLKASQEYSKETGVVVKGIKVNWLPIDTRINSAKLETTLDWESLRGKERANSVLVAHMPTESSALFSSAINGLYPPRQRVIYKKSRVGLVQFLVQKDKFLTAWEVDNNLLAKYYSLVQDFTDQGISADYYVVPENFEGGRVSLSTLMKEWVVQARLGNKSMYYQNTRDKVAKTNRELLEENTEEEACESCSI